MPCSPMWIDLYPTWIHCTSCAIMLRLRKKPIMNATEVMNSVSILCGSKMILIMNPQYNVFNHCEPAMDELWLIAEWIQCESIINPPWTCLSNIKASRIYCESIQLLIQDASHSGLYFIQYKSSMYWLGTPCKSLTTLRWESSQESKLNSSWISGRANL